MIREAPEHALLREQVARFIAPPKSSRMPRNGGELSAARIATDRCVWPIARDRDGVEEISRLEALAGELASAVVHACQQFHGGMGYIRETASERLWRDARVLAIGGSATEVMLAEAVKRT
jgi:acyl-CoA dehydrogenase